MKRFVFLACLLAILLVSPAEAQLRGYPYAPRVRSWRIGLEAGVGVLGSDLTKESRNYHFRPIANLELAFIAHKNFAFGLYGGGGFMRSTADDMESNTRFVGGGVVLELRIPTLRGSVFPIVQLRGGGVIIDPELREGRNTFESSSLKYLTFSGAAGVEVVSWGRLGVRALFGVTYTNTDKWDLIVRGDDKDGYSFAVLSMHYYITPRR
ncbi:MAG: hypothetical protein IH600_18635 [Bacteroidetes bacterium]|nr:hypothetical protein [Bacteroidota bacterium]